MHLESLSIPARGLLVRQGLCRLVARRPHPSQLRLQLSDGTLVGVQPVRRPSLAFELVLQLLRWGWERKGVRCVPLAQVHLKRGVAGWGGWGGGALAWMCITWPCIAFYNLTRSLA